MYIKLSAALCIHLAKMSTWQNMECCYQTSLQSKAQKNHSDRLAGNESTLKFRFSSNCMLLNAAFILASQYLEETCDKINRNITIQQRNGAGVCRRSLWPNLHQHFALSERNKVQFDLRTRLHYKLLTTKTADLND